MSTATSIPLSLYIHIPWCEKKCPYCDFNSHTAKANVNKADNEAAYVKAILADLDTDLKTYAHALKGRSLSSIFIGGGTPSLFSAESMSKILDGVADRIEHVEDMEVTLEANPGSSEADKFLGFRQAGVNRLSIGVQSFKSAHLAALGRVHGSAEAISAAHYARVAGFDNFNMDLMFGLPQQSIEQAIEDLEQAIKLAPTHLSCYQLTIEPNTLFHHSPPATPDEDSLWEMQSALGSVLAKNNYQQYEVSAWAMNHQRCQHNLNYWQFGDYLGIGAGAHGKITDQDFQLSRNWKIKHPTSYLNNSAQGKSLTGANNDILALDIPFEFMMNALRLTQGFKLDLFEQRTGQDRKVLQPQLEKHIQQGLISLEDDEVSLSARGKAMVNNMLQDYLID
jgi:oxygen-independent coproporphyrinogen-3 oxidase